MYLSALLSILKSGAVEKAVVIIALAGSISSAETPCSPCKCRAFDSCWPANAAWEQLNKTTNGHLIRTTPPGISCYPGTKYDEEHCNFLTKVYTDADLISQNPSMIDYPGYAGNPCPPDNDTESLHSLCDGIGLYPAYVINATNVAAVQAGINFARENNIRLIVKATGHDFLGRSAGAHSLSIYLHYWKGVEFHTEFRPEGSDGIETYQSVTISPGMQWKDVYRIVDEEDQIIVGGGASTVSAIGGYLQGGGHSPISSIYGLAVDQVLEMEVVLPNGTAIVANDYQNRDVFWALRGGGPSTFGVVTSATMKTYKSQPWYFKLLFFNLSSIEAPRDNFYDAITYFHTQIPRINDAGMMGYYFIYNDSSAVGSTASKTPIFSATLFMLNGTSEKAGEILSPVLKELRSSTWGQNLTSFAVNQTFPSFHAWFNQSFLSYAVEGTPILASRLLSNRSLTENVPLLKHVLQTNFEITGALQGHIVAGPGVAQHRDVSMALNPAWRDTYSHLISPTGFLNNGTYKVEQMQPATQVLEYGFRQLAPNSGAYLSESFIGSTDWQYTNWGTHYPRLLSLKAKYDPENVFYCVNCVGSENWVELNDTLCKVY